MTRHGNRSKSVQASLEVGGDRSRSVGGRRRSFKNRSSPWEAPAVCSKSFGNFETKGPVGFADKGPGRLCWQRSRTPLSAKSVWPAGGLCQSPRSDKGIRSRTGWPPSAAGKGPGRLVWQRSGRAFMPMGPGASRQIVRSLFWQIAGGWRRGSTILERNSNATSTIGCRGLRHAVGMDLRSCAHCGKLLKPDARLW